MKTGDRVACTKPTGSLIKDKVYTICDITQMPCGCVVVSIGEPSPYSDATYSCDRHGVQNHPLPDTARWYYSNRFAPIAYNSAHMELCNIVEEKIDAPIPVEQEV